MFGTLCHHSNQSLLRYKEENSGQKIGFWQEQLHARKENHDAPSQNHFYRFGKSERKRMQEEIKYKRFFWY